VCIFGVFGLQRLYLGKIGSGILYLLTFGLCGIGQLIDLFLIPEIVRSENMSCSAETNTSFGQHNVIVNVGDHRGSTVGFYAEHDKTSLPVINDDRSPTQKVLLVASEEPVTMARICLLTGLEYGLIKPLVETMTAEGLLTAEMSESGIIRYRVE